MIMATSTGSSLWISISVKKQNNNVIKNSIQKIDPTDTVGGIVRSVLGDNDKVLRVWGYKIDPLSIDCQCHLPRN